MRKLIGFLFQGLRQGFVIVGALVFAGSIIALADYTASQGVGTTFASVVVSSKHYVAMLICDFSIGETQCTSVDASNRLATISVISPSSNAIGSVSATVSGSVSITGTPNVAVTNTPAVTCAACATSANQTSEITALTSINTAVNASIPAGSALIGAINIGQVSGAAPAPSNPLPIEESTGSSYANRSAWFSGVGTASATTAQTVIVNSPSANRLYVPSLQCGRTDAASTATFITLNDSASTIVVLPNNGGGGGNNMQFAPPLSVAATTALKFTPNTSIATIYCAAQVYNAP
jgi:hypothetical protein